MTPPTLYFAYGSNLNLARMAERCPAASPLGRAVVPGWRFLINERGVATIEPSVGASTWGGLWLITPQCHESLDHYEGVRYGTYRHAQIMTVDDDREACSALTYLAANARAGAPSDGYLRVVLDGARDFDLPEDYIERLAQWGRRAA